MHLHSFAYDFHVEILSERLTRLIQKQKTINRNNYGDTLSEQRSAAHSIAHSTTHSTTLSTTLSTTHSTTHSAGSKSDSDRKKNAIAGFLDDFLKYYTSPPLYSCSLVLTG